LPILLVEHATCCKSAAGRIAEVAERACLKPICQQRFPNSHDLIGDRLPALRASVWSIEVTSSPVATA